MNIGLIVIGDEILSGRRKDGHLVKLIEILAARGLSLTWAQFIGDDPARITAVLRQASASGDLVFCCGGIGATPDDHTRACAAQALGRPLAAHPQAQALILARVREVGASRGWAMELDHPDTQRRLEMGVFPQGAAIVPNPYNRIPGFSVDRLYFLPGFPVMAWPMMEWVLEQRAAELPPTRWVERALIVRGAMEAALTPLMESLEASHAGIKVFSLPSVDHPVHGAHIELGVKGADVDQVNAALEALRTGLIALNADLVRAASD